MNVEMMAYGILQGATGKATGVCAECYMCNPASAETGEPAASVALIK